MDFSALSGAAPGVVLPLTALKCLSKSSDYYAEPLAEFFYSIRVEERTYG